MKLILQILIVTTLFFGCSKSPEVLFSKMPKTYMTKATTSELPNWSDENYKDALNSFINSCQSKKTKKIYASLCSEARLSDNPKEFLETEFNLYKIESDDKALLTGYYEPNLRGSLVKKEPYIYPIYTTPNDLIVVDLSSIYPALKNYRLRGRLEGKKIVPYSTREEMQDGLDSADIICYTDSKIDLFFLEVQGSGRVTLEDGETIFIGYANQNGHKYRSIGRYLVKNHEIPLEDISLQTIKAWLKKNPQRVDEVLNYNNSVVYFKQKDRGASGSLGLELTPKRSVAVDRNYIPLGSMLYLDAKIDDKSVSRVVMAEDTGGAIKGALRADMFFGFSPEAMRLAGELKSPLKLWLFMPKGEE